MESKSDDQRTLPPVSGQLKTDAGVKALLLAGLTNVENPAIGNARRLLLSHAGPGVLAALDSVREVYLERLRQIETLEYDAAHDDLHSRGELVAAAMCYVQAARGLTTSGWPEGWGRFRNGRPAVMVVKAAALLLAEAGRLKRLPPPLIPDIYEAPDKWDEPPPRGPAVRDREAEGLPEPGAAVELIRQAAGKLAYSGWRTTRGRFAGEWDSLPETDQAGWIAAGNAVIDAVILPAEGRAA